LCALQLELLRRQRVPAGGTIDEVDAVALENGWHDAGYERGWLAMQPEARDVTCPGCA